MKTLCSAILLSLMILGVASNASSEDEQKVVLPSGTVVYLTSPTKAQTYKQNPGSSDFVDDGFMLIIKIQPDKPVSTIQEFLPISDEMFTFGVVQLAESMKVKSVEISTNFDAGDNGKIEVGQYLSVKYRMDEDREWSNGLTKFKRTPRP